MYYKMGNAIFSKSLLGIHEHSRYCKRNYTQYQNYGFDDNFFFLSFLLAFENWNKQTPGSARIKAGLAVAPPWNPLGQKNMNLWNAWKPINQNHWSTGLISELFSFNQLTNIFVHPWVSFNYYVSSEKPRSLLNTRAAMNGAWKQSKLEKLVRFHALISPFLTPETKTQKYLNGLCLILVKLGESFRFISTSYKAELWTLGVWEHTLTFMRNYHHNSQKKKEKKWRMQTEGT